MEKDNLDNLTNVDRMYIGIKCVRCSRRHKINTELNLEGHIHHKTDFVCFDKVSCRRAQRKNKK